MSVTVVFGTQRFKTAIKPQILLSSVRDQACSALNLSNEEYSLFHRDKEVDLTLPWRLSGFVNNAQLDLRKKSRKTPADLPIRIKIKFSDQPDFVGSYPGSHSIGQILSALGLNGELLLNNAAVDSGAILGNLGVGLMFVFRGTTLNDASIDSGRARPLLETPSQKSLGVQPESKASARNRDAKIIVPSERFAGELSVETESPEMNSNQFLTYMHHLKSQSEPPMLSKQTKQELLKAQLGAVGNTVCRIKFPDQNCLEGVFAQGETGEDVYKFVSMHLADPRQEYELVFMKPHFVLKSDMLLSSTLGKRALLIFRPVNSKQQTGFFNKRALNLISNDTNAQQSSSMVSVKPSDTSRPSQDPPGPTTEEKPKKKMFKNKLPKWLKLHK